LVFLEMNQIPNTQGGGGYRAGVGVGIEVSVRWVQGRRSVRGRCIEDEVFLRVGFTVAEVAFVVIIGFFSHCDNEDKDEGSDVG